jgi:hypothetical protein
MKCFNSQSLGKVALNSEITKSVEKVEKLTDLIQDGPSEETRSELATAR